MKSKEERVLNDCIVDSEYLDITLEPPLENPVIQLLIDPYTKWIVGYKVVDETCEK